MATVIAQVDEYQPVVVRADQVQGAPQGQWTYSHYAALPDDGRRYEIIDGVLYMPPAPSYGHQSANNLFATYLTIHVQFTGLGRVLAAPFDVELAPNVVVQPDVIVVLAANQDIITPSRIIGAPDLVVEIASPGTATYDRSKKLPVYERAGVGEYWIVDPITQSVEVLLLENDSYQSKGVFAGQSLLPSRVVPDLPVRVNQFFT
jgi:Uma2 family endonuclease